MISEITRRRYSRLLAFAADREKSTYLIAHEILCDEELYLDP